MIRVQDLSFSYEKKPILKNFSLALKSGEILAVMGPSGCGKSTFLQLIAGCLKPDAGSIQADGVKISYAFQEPRLFPWLTVRENLLAVLPKEKDRNSQEQKALSALQAVELENCSDLYPNALSGGMKSRVSLARALIHDGDLYLLDEPFAALDEELRIRLGNRLKHVIKERGASAILVTHHRDDAERLADRIVILENQSQQAESPC